MIISLNMFDKEQIVLNINSKNKSSFKKAIKDDEINDIDAINKVKLGQGWHSGELYIYRTFQKAEKIIVTEGNFRFTNLQKYVIEHGYSLDKYGILFLLNYRIIIYYIWKTSTSAIIFSSIGTLYLVFIII